MKLKVQPIHRFVAHCSNLHVSLKAPLLLTYCAVGICGSFLPVQAFAQEEKTQVLEEVVISANRTAQRVLDTAASINVVNSAQIHDAQGEINLSEPLAKVPGIFALDRQNYAQDLLISSRGFGSNSAFGARGIKIFVDGIPGTVADGQGQISHIDLSSTDRMEVMRGPFSVLYGNAAGGVISVYTEDGKKGHAISPSAEAGSFGLRKYGLKFDGDTGSVNYLINAGKMRTDGYRDHSTADRTNENVKLRLHPLPDSTLTLIGNNVQLNAMDPLGLTATQWQANARQSGTNSLTYNTRKSVDQMQGGAVWNTRIDAQNTLILTPYHGSRHTTQFLASGTAGAGVIDLEREYYGFDGKWIHNGNLKGLDYKVVTGAESNQNQDHRLTYTNANGLQSYSTSNQDYRMNAKNWDQYLQAELHPSEQLTLTSGVRRSQTSLSATGNNLASPTLGNHPFKAATGMISAQYYFLDSSNVYISYGSGFDTPTLNQITYSTNYVLGSTTSNIGNMNGILAARTRQTEIGLKSIATQNLQLNVALFDANTTNDIVVAASRLGKTSYTNAPLTSRQGAEVSAQWQLPMHFQLSLGYTDLVAKVQQSYYTQTSSASQIQVNAGNRIPGVPNKGAFSELLWKGADKKIELALEARAQGSIAVNDVNDASLAKGYAVVNVRALIRQQSGKWQFSEFLRVNNLLGRQYMGSIIVNQASAQYYESAPGRNFIMGLKVSHPF